MIKLAHRVGLPFLRADAAFSKDSNMNKKSSILRRVQLPRTPADWLEAVQALRRQGEIVVVTLPCQAPQTPELVWCDRILTRQNGVWCTQPMQSA